MIHHTRFERVNFKLTALQIRTEKSYLHFIA